MSDVYPPNPAVQGRAHIDSLEAYQQEYQRSVADPQAYLGIYYSPEVEALYEIRSGEEGLILYNLRRGELPLVATEDADTFAGGEFFVSELRFTRDDTGSIDGF